MSLIRRLLLAICAICITDARAWGPGDASLPAPVAQALRSAAVPPTAAGVWVQEAGRGKPLVALNPRTPMNPASVMKLLTTYAALELLGPAHTWKTEALIDGPLEDGVLAGNLYLRGGGDPKLTIDALWLWLRELRARGLRQIRGDVVFDRSLFEPAAQEPGGFDGQPLRAYNVIPDALLLNFKALQLSFVPNATQGYDVLSEPMPPQLEILSFLKATEGICEFWRSALRYDLTGAGEHQRLVFSGSIPASCGVQTWSLAPLDHHQYGEALLRDLWHELGGQISGTVHDGAVPTAARSFATHESPPLAEQIRDVNKFSNNVMARQIFLTLGAAAGHTPAHEADGEAALRAWLKARDLAMPELVLENGSGLSRRERISAESLGRLLTLAWKSPVMPEFIASMPLYGVDGTLRKRNNDASGRAHLKGGTLDGVRSVAGYVLDRSGRCYIVVLLVNHANAGATQAVQDALVQWIAERD